MQTAGRANMGLQTWKGERPIQSDAMVARNYLADAEVKELNGVTSILLDVFQDQVDVGRLTTMAECATLLAVSSSCLAGPC